jgi:16S rRNA (cytidine1402-2'-O)-methyltransferase
MQKKDKKGHLYIVSTPIGNLKDITIRALETMRSVSFIAAENRGRIKKLLNAYGIEVKIISYREDNRERAIRRIILEINAGHDVALVSDAGTPLMSDPGFHLVRSCFDEGIRVIPIPGVSSIVAALSVSGIDPKEFVFLGFLPRKGKKREEFISGISKEGRTIIIFESPIRLLDTLHDLSKQCGDRNIAVCRELTKMYEEVLRGSILEIMQTIEERGDIKGEIVIVISGVEKKEREKGILDQELFEMEMKRITTLKPSIKTKELARILSERLNISVTRAYDEVLKAKRSM